MAPSRSWVVRTGIYALKACPHFNNNMKTVPHDHDNGDTFCQVKRAVRYWLIWGVGKWKFILVNNIGSSLSNQFKQVFL